MVSKGEKTRQRILEKAQDLFISNGLAATSMRDIADASGLTPGSLYNHFKGKDQLFDAVLEENSQLDQFLRNIQLDDDLDAKEYLRKVIKQFIDHLMTHENYIRLSLIDAQERDGQAIQKMPPKMFPVLFSSIAKMKTQDDGTLRDIPLEAVIRTMISLIMGYLATEIIAKPSNSLPIPDLDYVDHMIDIFFHGIIKEDAS